MDPTKLKIALKAAEMLNNWAIETSKRSISSEGLDHVLEASNSVKASCGTGGDPMSGGFGPKTFPPSVLDYLSVEERIESKPAGDRPILRDLLSRKYIQKESLGENEDGITVEFFKEIKDRTVVE